MKGKPNNALQRTVSWRTRPVKRCATRTQLPGHLTLALSRLWVLDLAYVIAYHFLGGAYDYPQGERRPQQALPAN